MGTVQLLPLLLLLLLLFCGGSTPAGGCNETRMLELLPRCRAAFSASMHSVAVGKWCDLAEFIVLSYLPGQLRLGTLARALERTTQTSEWYYESFTNCTEAESLAVGCYWPNPLAQSFLTSAHRQFFSNCSVEREHWEDPPDEVLVPLIALPVLLTVAMVALVVWRSKHTDQPL